MRDTERVLVDDEETQDSVETDEYAVVEFKATGLKVLHGCIAISPGQISQATGRLGHQIEGRNKKSTVLIPLSQALFIY